MSTPSASASWPSRLRQQLPATFSLAFPMVIGQAGQMVMILIDMLMVGKLGPEAIGGVGLASAIFYVFTLFAAGVLYGLDPLVSQAFGGRQLDRCHYWLIQALYLSALLSIPFVLLLQVLSGHLDLFGFSPALTVPASQFLSTLSLSMPPFLVFIAFRQYLQSTGSARPGSVVVVLAIFFNILFNLTFIFGTSTIPAMGVAGAGLATTLTRTMMAVAMAVYALYRDQKNGWGLRTASRRIDAGGQRELLAIGVPAGIQVTLEASVFSFATALMSRVGVVAAASHTITLNITSFTFMAPLGLAGAAAVLVGQQVGANRPDEARAAGWTSLGLSVILMAASGLLLVVGATAVSGAFTQDREVIALTSQLLILVAVYQIADGIQAVGAGALRGLGDTRSAMIATLVGYWGVGLPIGCWLCFHRHLGALGMWIGLACGVFAVAGFVLWRWIRATIVGETVAPRGESTDDGAVYRAARTEECHV